MITASCDCGWGGEFQSQGRADFNQRRHSCDVWRAKTERSQRYATRMAAVDRTPKQCRHTGATHHHGHYLMYRDDECRCVPCVTAGARWRAVSGYRMANGLSERIDATPASEHVRRLVDAGMSVTQISAAADVHETTIRRILHDAQEQLRHDNAAAILAVPLNLGTEVVRGLVDATGVRRRARALVALGYNAGLIADMTGLGKETVKSLVYHDGAPGDRVKAATRRGITELYEKLSIDTGPRPTGAAATRARRTAQRRGWPVPLSWDDDTIDDPGAEPFIDQTVKRGGKAPADLDEFMHLVRGGVGYEEAAERLGVLVESVSNRARDLGRPDIVVMLAEAVHRVRHAKDAPSRIRDEMTLRANLPARREVA
jgi:DNA-directed RNA polymerase specialized sigma24 family protein